jgi:glycosyltransferase involved in cell wall biosynthesis
MARVSIVLPTHNRPALLAEALDSIRSQTYSDWECLIVDDESTPPVMLGQTDSRIKVLRHSVSQGGAASKNAGIDGASGEILAFLDDDDLYAESYLERAVGVLDRQPDLDVVFMGVSWFGSNRSGGQKNYDNAMTKTLEDAQGGELEQGVLLFGSSLLDALLKSVPMAFQRPVVRKSALARIGKYRPDCLLWDCDWAISAALNARTGLVLDGLYRQRAEGQGYSSRGDRKLEHLDSGIEIKDRFLRDSILGHHSQYAAKFRNAAAQAWFDLAWHHYQQQERGKALGALFQSERRKFSLHNFKLVARLVVPGK